MTPEHDAALPERECAVNKACRHMTAFELKILEGCRAIAPREVMTGPTWCDAAQSLAARGLLKKHEHPAGSTHWPSYSITPEGLRALRIG